jgi:hypothetical protein
MLKETLRQHHGLRARSPFATTTWRLERSLNWRPAQATASRSTKLCVDPESMGARRHTPLMSTWTYIVFPDHGWMSVNAWMEIVGSARSADGVWSSSSSITSMQNIYLQTCLRQLVKNSSQWKHWSSFRCCTISAGVRRLTLIVSLAVEAPAVAWGGTAIGEGS